MNEDELDRIYEAHIANGASEEDAMRAVDLAASGSMGRQVADEAKAGRNLPAQRRESARRGSSTGDFTRQGLRGLTFGASDELRGVGAALTPGGDTYAQARDKERQIQGDLDVTAPGASAFAQIAGGVALPVGAGGQTMRAGKGLLRGMLAGGAAGGIQGYLSHVGNSAAETVADKSVGALPDVALGAGIGAFAGALPASTNASFARPVGKQAKLFARKLRGLSGVSDDLVSATEKAEEALARARSGMEDLSHANPAIKDPRVLAALNSGNPAMTEAVEEIAPGGFGLTSKQPGGKFGKGRLPSLDEARNVRQEIEGGITRAARDKKGAAIRAGKEAKTGLTDALRESITDFGPRDREYGSAMGMSEGLGTKLAPKTGAETELILRGELPSMQEGIRTRLAHDYIDRAGSGEGRAFLRSAVEETEASDPTLARIRNTFPRTDKGDKAFEEFMAELRLMRSARSTSKTGRRVVGAAAIAGGLGAAGLLP